MAMRRAAGSLLSAVKDTLRVQVEAPAMGSLRKYGATTATQQAHNAQGALAVLFNSFKNGTGLLSGGKRLYGDAALSKDEVTARVLEVVKNMDKVDPSKVNAESCDFTKDLGLDSLDTVEVVMAFEEEFQLEIPDDEADKIASCQQAIEYISQHPMVQ